MAVFVMTATPKTGEPELHHLTGHDTAATCAKSVFQVGALAGPGSQRVRGSNPLSSTPTSWILISVFLLVTGGLVADGRLLIHALTTCIQVDCGRIVIARRRPSRGSGV